MEIRKIRFDEYEKLIDVMNRSFNFVKKEEQFETILPKLYFKDNDKMIHLGLFEEDELCASIGLYEMKLIRNNHSLKVGCIGAVSTLPEHRLKGYFSKLMERIIEVAKEEDYDLLFLGGDRTRYANFGFENGGRKFVFTLSKRNVNSLVGSVLSKEKLDENDEEAIKACLQLYNSTYEHMERTTSNFYKHLVSWKCVPYIFKDYEQIVGYVSINEETKIFEFVYKEGYRDSLLLTLVNELDEIEVQCSMKEYGLDLLNRINYYKVENTEMHLILHPKKVYTYLEVEDQIDEEFEKLDSRTQTRLLFGDQVNSPKFNNVPLYLFACDQG